MDDVQNPYCPPQTPIGVPPIPLRWRILRWAGAIFSSLCSVIPLYFAGLIVYLTDNRIRTFGGRDFVERRGSAMISLMVLDLGLIASSGVMFLLAARSLLTGRVARFLVWFVAACGAGALGFVLLR